MDLSALIFVALAVAWAVYLIPKALRHHEIDRVSRPVDSFSDRVRVLARREPVSASRAALVVGTSSASSASGASGAFGTTDTAAAAAEAPAEQAPAEQAPAEQAATRDEAEVVVPRPQTGAQLQARKLVAARAARRRRRVLGTILLLNAVVIALAAAGTIGWLFEAIPSTVLLAWLVACRLMVRKERAVRAARLVPVRKRRTTLADQVIAEEDAGEGTEEIPAVRAAVAEAPNDPAAWDPVPVTLPTYVAKAPAGRTVRTIDLDSTGVWSSGRSAADSALAREAEQQRVDDAEPEQRQVSGA